MTTRACWALLLLLAVVSVRWLRQPAILDPGGSDTTTVSASMSRRDSHEAHAACARLLFEGNRLLSSPNGTAAAVDLPGLVARRGDEPFAARPLLSDALGETDVLRARACGEVGALCRSLTFRRRLAIASLFFRLAALHSIMHPRTHPARRPPP